MKRSKQTQQTIKNLSTVINDVTIENTFMTLPRDLQVALTDYADAQARVIINTQIRDGGLSVIDAKQKEDIVCLVGSGFIYGLCCGHNWVAKHWTLWKTEGGNKR